MVLKNNYKNQIFFAAAVAIFSFGIFTAYLTFTGAQINSASSAGEENIVYPIKELGSCKDKSECKAYCDNSNNISVCVDFAKKHNLISEEDAKKAEAFLKVKSGPGGCKGKDECEAFCDNIDHIDECLNFAEQNNLMPGSDIKEAKQAAKALKEGVKTPGECKNRKDCETYCNDPAHMDECLNFAEKAGFMSENELKNARQAAKAMASGLKSPGSCHGRKECETYCSDPSHAEECLNFAEAAGFMPKEEIEQARKMIPLMKEGKMPGGCKGKDECQAYCNDDSHFDECSKFAIDAGLIKPEEAEIFKKTGGKGPGGCKGKDECEAFCNDPTNQEVCFGFAKEHGLISPEEIDRMKEGMTKVKENMRMLPPEVNECLKSTVGAEVLDKIQAGTMMPSRQLGEQMRDCFEKSMPKMPEGIERSEEFKEEGTVPPAGVMVPEFKGPGGCQGPEECSKYCSVSEHKQECESFKHQVPQMPQGEKFAPERMMQKNEKSENRSYGPGGCQGAEECSKYCSDPSHQEECAKFQGHGENTKGAPTMPQEGMTPPTLPQKNEIVPPQKMMLPPNQPFPSGAIPESYTEPHSGAIPGF